MSDQSMQHDAQGTQHLSRIRRGMQVYGANDRVIGTVEEIHGNGFHVNGEHISAGSIARVTGDRIYLSGDYAQGASLAGDRAEGTMRVPIVEEHLNVEKREGQIGEVGIRREITEEQQTIPVELRREEVHVDRRDVADRPLTAAEADTAFEEGTIRVPVRGEEAYVTKEAVVTGEVVVTKEQTTERQQFTDTVRKQRVDIDEDYQRARTGFQEHFQTVRKNRGGRSFEEAEPNYRFGYEAAYDERYGNRSFEDIEPDLRTSYTRNSGRTDDRWEELREEIREGWNRARGY
jgi:uncharacterized protein (TIGR02271 family)